MNCPDCGKYDCDGWCEHRRGQDDYSAGVPLNRAKQGSSYIEGWLDAQFQNEETDYEPEDHTDDICHCGDPDCSRIMGHEVES